MNRAIACAVFLTVVTAACSSNKSGSESKAWPDRELVETTTTVGSHQVRLLLPKGVGAYQDPNGKIWRSVSPQYAFFIKVFKADYPKSVDAAVEQLSPEAAQKVISKKAAPDRMEIILQSADNGRHTIYLWKRKGSATVSCTGILGQKIGDQSMVDKSNRWLYKICDSLQLL